MKSGKLNWDDLNQIIENNRGTLRDDVRIRSGIGEDCSSIIFGDYECVVSTDPITGADKNIGKLAVHINCNDIASSGAEPIGILTTILVPEGTTLEEINDVMKQINDECNKMNIEILGGHTEITKSVNKIIVSCTVIGKSLKNKAVATSGVQVGDDIIVTKNLCLEGTSILVNDYNDISSKILTEDEMKTATSYINQISVVKEGMIAGEFGVNSMHDITEGGVLGALWETAEAGKVGFNVCRDKMPISDITDRLCKKFNINPLKFISSGSMLITCKEGNSLVNRLKSQGINACIIGNITKEKGIINVNGAEIEVDAPERDELFNISREPKSPIWCESLTRAKNEA